MSNGNSDVVFTRKKKSFPFASCLSTTSIWILMAATALGFMVLSSLEEEEKEKLACISGMLSP